MDSLWGLPYGDGLRYSYRFLLLFIFFLITPAPNHARLVLCMLPREEENREPRAVAASSKILTSTRIRLRSPPYDVFHHSYAFTLRQHSFIARGVFVCLGQNQPEIQRVYRGFKGRLRAKARRRVFEMDLGREAAAMAIERVYRGHKASQRHRAVYRNTTAFRGTGFDSQKSRSDVQ